MNFHRYKIKIPLRSFKDENYEFLGTWIGVGGMIATLIAAAISRDLSEAITIGIALSMFLYFLYFFCVQYKSVIYVFFVISVFVSLFFGVMSVSEYTPCELIENDVFRSNCPAYNFAPIVFAVYALSLVVTSAKYIIRDRKKKL
jgi:hypothetical protein